MLYILTGEVQIGKSRWLEQLANDLGQAGVTCLGVIAPGVWIESDSAAANEHGYEKLGIDNLLLPERILIPFAQRVDIARENGTYHEESQAGRVGLGWHINEDALARVNAHLASIPKRAKSITGRKLLVIDELGRLELHHDGGLVEAVKLLETGPQVGIENALVVARQRLADEVERRFDAMWSGAVQLAPSPDTARLIMRRSASQ